VNGSLARLPTPDAEPPVGHLARWTFAPIPLLREGAARGHVFRLRLWRQVVVGYSPDWNRAILGDLETFRSRGSLSGLTPYLSAGVVHADVPEHDQRRAELNPSFHRRSLTPLLARLDRVAAAQAPLGQFDALAWASETVQRMLNEVFFAGRLDATLLARFLAPLVRPAPAPMLPRPRLFRRLDRAIADLLPDPPDGTLSAQLAPLAGAVEEIRVALAAGYDTTAHTLAWAVWHLAEQEEWRRPELLPAVLDEVLRLFPAGWVGSRVAARDVTVTGIDIPAGTMTLYSPYLTHRDPRLWPDPDAFRPQRFADGRPAWGFLPFSAGRRTCLGAHLARAMLTAALRPLCDGKLLAGHGVATVRAGITLRPTGPLWVERAAT
jgi:cytochrome P450